jgi:two-component system phosphate regulon sensor histidine kinase PhoR
MYQILMCIQKNKDMILIKVQDKGLGMSKVAQKRVLKSFIENTLEIYIMLKVMV